MSDEKKTAIKLRHISIRNYKGIDSLDLDFPEPLMSGDPDVLVMGSENGLGKTSVLECCALLLLAVTVEEDVIELQGFWYAMVDLPDLVIRAGADHSEISGVVSNSGKDIHLQVELHRDGTLRIPINSLRTPIPASEYWKRSADPEDSLRIIWGFAPVPLIERAFMAFNSYRKVQEGNPELGMMVEKPGFRGRNLTIPDSAVLSAFKIQVLRSMMGRAKLFEFDDLQVHEQDTTIEKLNELMSTYARGTFGKLRPSPDNSVEFRVEPTNGGASFTFDGLSSGQKEIVSTLFLIWYHTRNNPMVVLIDEPELHLNAQWHRKFVRTLFSVAPDNQYIMATHSEFIMDSVDRDRRVLLSVEPSVTV